MGSGIAGLSALKSFTTILFDIDQAKLDRSKSDIKKNLEQLSAKQKISAEEILPILGRISFVNSISQCKADFIIEAIIENEDAKVNLLNDLIKVNNKDCLFATNTSSLNISSIQKKISSPERLAGMHFFNPPGVMKLVEIIKGDQTREDVLITLTELSKKLGKVPVHCTDSPGFIVNRVARHYYLEAMKLIESGIATIENVDTIMESAGFKMGPFKLMDLIGVDINLAVSESLYNAFNHNERFKPSEIQIEKVKKGYLGRKTGNGFYHYN